MDRLWVAVVVFQLAVLADFLVAGGEEVGVEVQWERQVFEVVTARLSILVL